MGGIEGHLKPRRMSPSWHGTRKGSSIWLLELALGQSSYMTLNRPSRTLSRPRVTRAISRMCNGIQVLLICLSLLALTMRFFNGILGTSNPINRESKEEKPVRKYQFAQNIKIRDLRFNPHRPYNIAVQSSRKLQLIDIRKGNDIVASYEIQSNELHGIGVKWDPIHAHRVASAISK